MISVFFASMLAGHIYVLAIVTAVQVISFKEVIAIASVPSRARQLRFTKSLNWYFLASIMYFLYGESIIYYFKHIVLVDKMLLPFATHHRFISFMLYIIGASLLRSSKLHADGAAFKGSSSSSPLSRRGITASSSLSLPGRTWRCT